MTTQYWNLCNLLVNDDTEFDYTFSVDDLEGNTYTIWDSGDFRGIVMSKYWSFMLKSPGFYDTVQDKYINLCDDISDAISYLQFVYSYWQADRTPAIQKLFEALRGSYNPLWNVDGVTGTVHQSTHTGDITQTGHTDTTNTGQTDTTSTGQADTTNTGQNSTTRSGNQTNVPTGNEVMTTAKTTFDDDDFEDTEQVTRSFTTREDKTTYNNVKDEYKIDAQNPMKSSYKIDAQNPLKESYKIDAQNPLKQSYVIDAANPLKEARNLTDQDLEMIIRQGNIGVTSSQSLILQQIDVTDKDRLISYCINDFIHSTCVLIG